VADGGFYHAQPCFCLPCRAIKAKSSKTVAKNAQTGAAVEKPVKKVKRKK
jgi:hypothetical protein